ncbi:methyl-accepting chemotaxis protein [Novimethylophilus kurashikiensis]|uniref:Methyl-accepting chemotaxis protein n=1 Tax=Novimethylophilus kurashikiensis TaxID=1825523 RepID=A0A2R5FA30_9PROT|nr:methyl-accepting chemotaxis protein [Novimethylophilus kurashikiensis]GBG14679.1 methyl-accepting chemotaxis protein [Novimethylophilus kurashikiensis]
MDYSSRITLLIGSLLAALIMATLLAAKQLLAGAVVVFLLAIGAAVWLGRGLIASYRSDTANFKQQSEQAVAEVQEKLVDYQGQIDAIGKSMGVIEFNLDGTVITANPNFLAVIDYTLDEVKGKHHRTFVDAAYAASGEYRAFWDKLNRGEYDAGEYKRIAKGGKEKWIQASYNPIRDANGKVYKVVKYAADITEQKIQSADFKGQVEAIGKSMGVIEFNLDGTVITANPTFLNVINYSLDEAKGRHHRTFVDPEYAMSSEYRAFWDKLNRGEYDAGEYKRIAKGGKEVWIQASYNPIRDASGRVYKVVKYAADITEQKIRNADYQGQIEAIGKSMGVIEFNLDGTVITANPNFLSVINYSLDEAKGKHHRTFVDAAYANSPEYRAFWERLNRGEYDSGEYKRIAKGGAEVWIQASYNPIRDASGRVYKVVKYASDITNQKRYQLMVEKVLADTRAVMTALSQGDLTQNMTGEYEGEFAVLSDSVVQSINNLREIVQQISEAADLISTASKEIAAGNTDLSQRTEEQASSLEETASSMEELASTVKQNAENAKQANQMASAASGVATKGGEVVSEVVETMSAINESSRKIVDIISVIDGIAFQTNILALNAAVEAARAGEQGRGFAVVAGEVRNLAQRSAAAAKEIKQLISDSVEKVDGGTRLVEEAGKTMQEIVQAVRQVTDIMAEITAASVEQSTGIDQVNQAVTQMDEVTQQNAALVEEAAAAAESLEEQAQTLAESVSRFKLDNTVVQLHRPAATSRKPAKAAVSVAAKSRAMPKLPKHDPDGDWEEF